MIRQHTSNIIARYDQMHNIHHYDCGQGHNLQLVVSFHYHFEPRSTNLRNPSKHTTPHALQLLPRLMQTGRRLIQLQPQTALSLLGSFHLLIEIPRSQLQLHLAILNLLMHGVIREDVVENDITHNTTLRDVYLTQIANLTMQTSRLVHEHIDLRHAVLRSCER